MSYVNKVNTHHDVFKLKVSLSTLIILLYIPKINKSLSNEEDLKVLYRLNICNRVIASDAIVLIIYTSMRI